MKRHEYEYQTDTPGGVDSEDSQIMRRSELERTGEDEEDQQPPLACPLAAAGAPDV